MKYSKKTLAKRIRSLARELDDAWDEENEFKLDENRVEKVQEKLERFACQIDGHDWTSDQCGQWHHWFCHKCMQSRHPGIAHLSCGDFSEHFGKMTLRQWNAKIHQRETGPQKYFRHPRSLVRPRT